MLSLEVSAPPPLEQGTAGELRKRSDHRRSRGNKRNNADPADTQKGTAGVARASRDGLLHVPEQIGFKPGGWSLKSVPSAIVLSPPSRSAAPGRAALQEALRGHTIHHIADGGMESVQQLAKALIARYKLQSNLYVVDLGRLALLHEAFVGAMPRVQPFYAAKCNPDSMVLKALAALGCGFDCASAAEMRKVRELGVPSSQIIFAHPCKCPDDLQCAVDLHVKRMTFDCEDELDKIAEAMPGAELVLRIKADDPSAFCQFGHKYGSDPVREAPALLHAAKQRGLSVVGVSFHIGSGSQASEAYQFAIRAARSVFDIGESLGFAMNFLDLGGGFYGRFDSHGKIGISAAASVINAALATYFPAEAFADLKVIAEPGRYFAQSIATFFTLVHTSKHEKDEDGNVISAKYYACDGIYGSFNNIIFDHGGVAAKIVRSPLLPAPTAEQQNTRLKSTVFGPTCDGIDVIYKEVPMPVIRRGDWLQVPNFGAYTVSGACKFNGMPADAPVTAYAWSARPVGTWESAESFAAMRGRSASGDVAEQQLTFHSTLADLELL